MKILFYLPAPGAGGGTHSIAQECKGMCQLGVETSIAIPAHAAAGFRNSYPGLEAAGVSILSLDDAQQLAACLGGQDVVCATTFESAHRLKDAIAMVPASPATAYYIQDYEPLFFMPGSDRWRRALESYSILPDCTLFAKTAWLCDVVAANTGMQVHRVQPSIDHSIYFPGPANESSRLAISAMVRPATPRRAPRRTVRILENLVSKYGQLIDVTVFGASMDELADNAIRLSKEICNRGILTQTQVSGVLRRSDLFLDLSDYQAFGRTGIEAMASGCVPLLPAFGGSGEYVKHWVNGILVDTRIDGAALEEIDMFISLSRERRHAMRAAAIETASRYTVERAAASEIALFLQILGRPA